MQVQRPLPASLSMETATAVRLTPSLGLAGMLFVATVGVSACSVVATPTTLRGNKVDPDQLKELVIGTSTKADVTSLIGSPTARATFDDNRWLYISETTQVRIGQTPGVRAQDVVELTFDQGGLLRGIHTLGQDDGKDVAMVSRTTPSPGSEASFLQQLLGNVGKFSTGAVPGSGSQAPGGSGGSVGGQQGL
jgi:outer membrane protein assembly factor BamE (lipoprotein component of BamABCDE complex)